MYITMKKSDYDDKRLLSVRTHEEMQKISTFDLFLDGILYGKYRFLTHPDHEGYRVATFPGRNIEMDEIDFILALMEELFSEGYQEGKDRIRNALENYIKNGSPTFNNYFQTNYKANTSHWDDKISPFK